MTEVLNSNKKDNLKTLSSKKLKSLMASTTLAVIGLAALTPSAAHAVDALETPTGENVVGGSASFDRPNEGLLNIDQHTDRVYIDWDTFNVGSDAKTEFFQPNSNSLAVNRVVGIDQDPTQILGELSANGRLMVIDRNGVFFGAGSIINVNSIIATTGDVNVDAVMSGSEIFEMTDFGDGAVLNYGTINAADAGLVALVGSHAANHGIINAKMGKVVLAASGNTSTVTLDFYGDQLLEIAVTGEEADVLVENTGTINAEGGVVTMTAQTAKGIVDNVVNMSGIVNVASATQVGGKVILSGGDNGKVSVSGTIDASGETGGGEIIIEGDEVDIEATGELLADALIDGDGGNIFMLGQNLAVLSGRASARGGVSTGNGGFIELSSAQDFGLFGTVDTSAANGENGTFLIDPRDIEIRLGTGFNLSLNNIYESTIESLSNVTDIYLLARRNITVSDTIYGAGSDGVITLAEDSSLTIATFNEPYQQWRWTFRGPRLVTDETDNSGIIDLTGNDTYGADLEFRTSGDGDINIFGALSDDQSSDIILSKLTTEDGDINIDTNNGTVTFEGDVTTQGGNITSNATDSQSVEASMSSNGGDISITTEGETWEDRIFIRDAVSSDGGLITLANEAGNTVITQTGSVDAGDGDIDFTATTGAVNFYANATASADTISFNVGQVNQNAASIITAGLLEGSVLRTADFSGTSNQIDEIGDFATGTVDWNDGGFIFRDLGGVEITGTLSSTGGDIDVYSDGSAGAKRTRVTGTVQSGGGNISLGNNKGKVTVTSGGVVDAGTGNVNFSSVTSFINLKGGAQVTGSTVDFQGRDVQQDAGGVITADTITGSLERFAELIGTGNQIGAIGNFEVGTDAGYDDSKGFQLVNATNLDITGNVSTTGADIDIDVTGDLETSTGSVNANGGNIDLFQTGVFVNGGTDTVQTSGEGTINLVQNEGGLIQDAIDAVENTGTGLNTVTVSAGDFAETLAVYENNFLVKGANFGLAGNDVTRSAETVVDPNSPGILITGNDVTVDGFTFTDGDSGVEVDGASNATIQNNVISANTDNGVLITNGASGTTVSDNAISGGTYGVNVTGGSSNTDVSGNDISGTGTGIIFTGGLTNADAVDNDISNATVGILVTGNSDEAEVKENDISNTATAIQIEGGSDYVDVIDNDISNSTDGIIITGGATNAEVDGNEIKNVATGITVRSGAHDADVIDNDIESTTTGISITAGVTGAEVKENEISGTGTGISVSGGATNADIIDNDISSVGTGIIITGGATGAEVKENDIKNAGTGIIVRSGANNADVIDNTIQFATTGISVTAGVTGTEVKENDIDNVGTGISVDGGATKTDIIDNDIDFVGTGISVSGGADYTDVEINNINQATVGINVSGNADYADIEDNIITNADTGITISNTNWTDVFGNDIDGDTAKKGGSNGQYGITSTSNTNLEIGGAGDDANTINDYDTGIQVTDSGTVRIENNDVYDATTGIFADNVTSLIIEENNLEAGDTKSATTGIYVEDSYNAQIGGYNDGNKVEGFDTGIQVVRSTTADIEYNEVKDSGTAISVSASDWADVKDNDIEGASTGIIITGDSDNVEVDDNDINNATVGIRVDGNSDYADIDDNDITNVSTGIYVTDTYGIDIFDNDIDARNTKDGSYGTYGIFVTNSGNVEIGDAGDTNYIDDFDTGIYVSNSNGVTIDDNDITDAFFGIHAENVSSLNIEDNDIEARDATSKGFNTTGILVEDSYNARIGGYYDGNDVDDFEIGIDVTRSISADIEYNEVDNANTGIRVRGNSDYADVKFNDIDDANNGIVIRGNSDYVEVDDNDINDTTVGIRVRSNSDYVDVDDNYITNTSTGIYVTDSVGTDIVDNYIDARTTKGGSYGEYGIRVEDSSDIEIGDSFGDGNDIDDFDTAIYVANSDNVEIDNNDITDALFGVYADNVSSLNIEDNDIDGRESDERTKGIYVEDSYNARIGGFSDGNEVEDFTVGIDVVRSRSADIEYNTVENTRTAIRVRRNSDWSDVKFNDIDNARRGVVVRGNSDFVDVEDNDINDTTVGIRVRGNSDYADVEDNDITNTSTGIYVTDSIGTDIFDNDIDARTTKGGSFGEYGIRVEDSSDIEIGDNSGDGNDIDDFDTGIYVANSSNVEVDNNDITDAIFGISASNVGGLNIEDNFIEARDEFIKGPIFKGGLTDGNSDLEVIVRQGENQRPRKVQTTGIYVEDSFNARIGGYNDGNHVEGFDTGVDVEGSFSADVEFNRVLDSGTAIRVDDSDYVDVKNNFILGASENGVDIHESDNAEIDRNIIGLIGNDGIHVEYSDDVEIDGNKIGLVRDDAIDLEYSDGAEITGNFVALIGDDGVSIDDSDNVVVDDNKFFFVRDDGVDADESEFLEVTNNTFRRIGENAIEITDSGDYYFVDNYIRGAETGISAREDSFNGRILSNDIAEVETGIEIIDGHNTIVDGNTVTGATGTGIYVDPSYNIVVSNNILDGNNIGIEFLDVETSVIAGNEITNSITTGIQLENVNSVDVLLNDISNSGQYGLFAAGPNNGLVRLSGNTFTDNPVSASFQSGDIDLTQDTNFFNGGDIALQFIPFENEDGSFADMSLVGDTIGNSFFSGQSTYFVELGNGAFFNPGTPTVLNAIDATYVAPFGTIQPRTTGIPVNAAESAFLESMFFHNFDDGSLGLFFYGQPDLSEEDFLNTFQGYLAPAGGVNVTLAGLPAVDPAQLLAALAPAAGGEATPAAFNIDDLANLEPAAGGTQSSCWGDAIASAGGGETVNFSFGGDGLDTFSAAGGCQSGSF